MSTQPYKTTAGKIVPLGELEQMVTRGIIMAESGSPGSQFVTIKRGNGQANLVKVIPGSMQIPAFSQPIIVELSGGRINYVVDVRPFVSITNAVNNQYRINTPSNYNISVEKAVIQMIADEMGSTRLLTLGTFPAWVFSQWITRAINRTMKLSIDAQNAVLCLSVYYWYCMHNENTEQELDRIAYTRLIASIQSVTGIEYSVINSVCSDLPIIRELSGFVEALKQKTGDARIASVDVNGLFVLVGTSISANDPRLTSAVSLESPVVFNVILKNTMTNNGAMRSALGEIVKPRMSSTNAKSFLAAYGVLIGNFNKTVDVNAK